MRPESDPPTTRALLRSYASGAASARAVVDDALTRAAQVGERYGAFAHLDVDGALRTATELDRRARSDGLVGPLHGVPIAVKENIDVAGLPATAGSRHLVGRIAPRDAACVRALRRAGAVIIGTTVTHEFAYGVTGDRSAHGVVRNPCSPGRMAGGSSAGSAAAVRAGVVSISVGTDTGGSIRIPASLTGVLGLKPTRGLIPTDGVWPLAPSLDHVGLHARTVDDLERALFGLGAEVPPVHTPVPPRASWLGTIFPPTGSALLAERLRTEAERVLGILPTVELAPRLVEAIVEDFEAVQGTEAVREHRERMSTAPERYDLEVLERLRKASRIESWRYDRALVRQRALTAEVLRLLESDDLLVCPTTTVVAPRLGQRTVEVDGAERSVRATLLAQTAPWNLLGFCALSVPVPGPGLPLGLQLIAAPGNEAVVLSAARFFVAPSFEDGVPALRGSRPS